MNQTDNLNLAKPEENEFYNISIQNENMDKIDAAVKAVSDKQSDTDTTIADLKKSVSDGKSKVAASVTVKGVSTAATDTFDVISSNIGKINVGVDCNSATASESDVVSGETFGSGSTLKTGTMPVHNGMPEYGDVENLTQDNRIFDFGGNRYAIMFIGSKTCMSDHTNFVGCVQNDLKPENIISGKTIFNQQGSIPVLQPTYTDHMDAPNCIYGANSGDNPSNPYVYMSCGKHNYTGEVNWLRKSASEVAALGGLTASKMVQGQSAFGITGTTPLGRNYASGTSGLSLAQGISLGYYLNVGRYNGGGFSSASCYLLYGNLPLSFVPSSVRITFTGVIANSSEVVTQSYTIGQGASITHCAATSGAAFSGNDYLIGVRNNNNSSEYIPMLNSLAVKLPVVRCDVISSYTWEAWE